jgi:hypothetical protein
MFVEARGRARGSRSCKVSMTVVGFERRRPNLRLKLPARVH